MDPSDARALKPLRTPLRLDSAGLTQAPDQRNPDEFAQPFVDNASDIIAYAEVYPSDGDPKPKHMRQAVGHVNALGATVRHAIRTIAAKESADDKIGVCKEVARRVVSSVPGTDSDTEDSVVRFLLLCSYAVA